MGWGVGESTPVLPHPQPHLGEERSSEHQSRVIVHFEFKSFPSPFIMLAGLVKVWISCFHHWRSGPEDSSLSPAGVYKQVPCLCACVNLLPLQSELILKSPLRESSSCGSVWYPCFLWCHVAQVTHRSGGHVPRGPERLERHLPCFFSACECTRPPHTPPSS